MPDHNGTKHGPGRIRDAQEGDMPTIPQPVRQGDVLLVPVPSIPDSATEVPRDRGRVILAYGEVTGHAHAITAKGATLLTEQDQRFLRIVGTADLVHEEHSTIAVAPGEYRVVIHREWTDEMGVRPVVD